MANPENNPAFQKLPQIESIEQNKELLNYFQDLLLDDIYGKHHDKPLVVSVSEEQYKRWDDQSIPYEERAQEKLNYAKQHGLSEMGVLSSDRKITEYSTRKLTHWIPSHKERQFIIWLAESVTEGGSLPTALEVGYGSGVVAKTLASSGKIKVYGFDTQEKVSDRYEEDIIPSLSNMVELQKGNIWEKVDEYGPSFNTEIVKNRIALLEAIKSSGSSFSIESTQVYGGHCGYPNRLNFEIKSLQETVHSRNNDSSIDIVLCSFMETGQELTIPIRDGIYPKAIVYVKPTSSGSFSGAGDFDKQADDLDKLFSYFDSIEEENGEDSDDNDYDINADVNPDSHISYNPGRNYVELTRWKTVDSYAAYMCRRLNVETVEYHAEVVVQIRKDVLLASNTLPNIEKFPFDVEIEEMLFNLSG